MAPIGRKEIWDRAPMLRVLFTATMLSSLSVAQAPASINWSAAFPPPWTAWLGPDSYQVPWKLLPASLMARVSLLWRWELPETPIVVIVVSSADQKMESLGKTRSSRARAALLIFEASPTAMEFLS